MQFKSEETITKLKNDLEEAKKALSEAKKATTAEMELWYEEIPAEEMLILGPVLNGLAMAQKAVTDKVKDLERQLVAEERKKLGILRKIKAAEEELKRSASVTVTAVDDVEYLYDREIRNPSLVLDGSLVGQEAVDVRAACEIRGYSISGTQRDKNYEFI